MPIPAPPPYQLSGYTVLLLVTFAIPVLALQAVLIRRLITKLLSSMADPSARPDSPLARSFPSTRPSPPGIAHVSPHREGPAPRPSVPPRA